MVGSAMSLANKTLSHCFSKILNSYNGSHQCIKIDQKYDSIRTITNVIHTLNFLRITTERRFMKAAHPRNFISSIKGRTFHKENGVYTCSEKVSNYNKVEGPPLWSGRPYGVVLNLSGIELSQAYLKSHDYINALFYAEFFADNQLGSSGNTFEQLRTLDCVQNSISGFGQPHTSFIENMKERPVNKSQLAIKFHSILEQCLSELHEDDALAGLEYQTCRIRFDHPQFFSASRNHVLRTMTPSEAMVTLMRLDNAAQEQSREAAFNDRLVLSSCMTQIGLRYVSRMFMSGTCATDFNSKLDQKKISEQWAEESWRLFQWEHFLPSDEKEFNISRWKQEDAWAPFYNKHDSTQTTGYHMSLKHSIHSLLENDLPNVWLHLSASRSSLIEDFNTSLRPKVQNRELCSLALKACTLNELEDLGLVCSTKMSPDAWLGKYCSNSSIFSNLSNLNMQFDELESSMAAHEVFLKVLYKKFGDNPCDHIGSTLTKHLWGVCRLARDSKKPNVALSALKRLRGFFKVESECSTLTLKYNLEEAKITQLFGNTSTSVQFCKEIITRLAAMEPLKRTNDENILLIQTQLQCAEWLTDYSIESNAIILDDLLKPAAHGAWMLYDKDKVKPSLVASSNYALGSFAANLYDSVQKRVNSHAWKLLGDAARGRQRQLEELKETVKMKRKSKSVDYRVSEYEYITLEKEVLMDSKERESVENSVEQYLELAIESFGRALSTSSCSFHDTKHVFQFISLWFRNCSNDSDINDIVSGWLLKIPR
jgi:Predicted carbamoyl transferase, NodU family